jgi:hypothetical protein
MNLANAAAPIAGHGVLTTWLRARIERSRAPI